MRLRVADGQGASDTLDQPLTISAGNTPPTATIDSPSSTTTWKVGDNISFSGSATDQQDGSPLSPSNLTWSLIMHHCSSLNSCHEHVVQEFAGVASGSFVAPDHEYPSYLELQLTATDKGRLSDTESVRLDPKTVELSFRSDPAGFRLTVGSASATTPFSRTVIAGSKNSISAPSPQTLAGTSYEFASWSDRGPQSHDIVAPDTAATYTATYTPSPDNTPPETTIISGSSGYVKSTSASFSFSSSEAGSTFQCRRDSSTFSACTSPKSYSSLSQGNHTFRVRAIDKAGNIDATPASRSWFVDTMVPNGTISINGGAASTASSSVTLSLSASDPLPASGVAWMRFRNEGTTTWSSWVDYSTSKSWTLSAGAGTKTVYVKYRDRAGNISAAASDEITFSP